MIDISMKLKDEFPALYQAALLEFSSTTYDNASLNKILKGAKMSKGSFYHNIGDKYTLYLMLLSCFAYRKVEIFRNCAAKNELPHNFFDKLKSICVMNCNFIVSEPLLQQLFLQYTKESADFLDKLSYNFNQDDKKIWIDMIKEGISKGEIRQDLPESIIISFMESSLKGLSSLMGENMTIDEFIESVTKYIDVIQDALSNRK